MAMDSYYGAPFLRGSRSLALVLFRLTHHFDAALPRATSIISVLNSNN
jgi:hypothetical protein